MTRAQNAPAWYLILSGEGEHGTWSAYSGTERGLIQRLTRERAHGDRWARAYQVLHETDGDQYALCGVDDPSDLRSLPIATVAELRAMAHAASTLGRRGGQSRSAAKVAASRENGKLGGRPRRVNRGSKSARRDGG